MMDKPTYEELDHKVKDLEEEALKRQLVEEALRQSEQRLSLALQATSDGIWDWDIRNGRTYASARCGEIFGIRDDGEVLPSQTWASRIHPDDYGRMSQCMQEHLKGIGPYDVEYRHRHGDGEYRWQHSRGMALFDEDGTAYRMVGSIRDITARKRYEAEKERLETRLRQAQRMEALGTLAGGVAHDFNNLLTAIMGNIDLSYMYARSDEKIRKSLVKAKEACRRAKALTRQFFTFAKSAHSEKKIRPIAKLVQNTAKFALIDTEVQCRFSITEDLFLVSYDEDQMEQVITNLINNASEAMDGQGTIEVLAENIYPDAVESNPPHEVKQIKISIQDQGVGIPQDVLDRIYYPYFSSKEMVTQKGLGLGLSICYSIIENHNGRIEVESEVGIGTCFHIYLPAV